MAGLAWVGANNCVDAGDPGAALCGPGVERWLVAGIALVFGLGVAMVNVVLSPLLSQITEVRLHPLRTERFMSSAKPKSIKRGGYWPRVAHTS